MRKIPTLFERERRSGKVTSSPSPEVLQPSLEWIATEKLNGVNVRLTVRNETMVRLEVRQPPTHKQREDGILTPWYADALSDEVSNRHYWLWNAARNTNLTGVPDGEWEGEAVGPKIQSDSLQLPSHRVFLFSLIPWMEHLNPGCPVPPVLDRVPTDYDMLMDWLPMQKSLVNPDVTIEGVVWWFFDEAVAKIKTSDFRYGT